MVVTFVIFPLVSRATFAEDREATRAYVTQTHALRADPGGGDGHRAGRAPGRAAGRHLQAGVRGGRAGACRSWWPAECCLALLAVACAILNAAGRTTRHGLVRGADRGGGHRRRGAAGARARRPARRCCWRRPPPPRSGWRPVLAGGDLSCGRSWAGRRRPPRWCGSRLAIAAGDLAARVRAGPRQDRRPRRRPRWPAWSTPPFCWSPASSAPPTAPSSGACFGVKAAPRAPAGSKAGWARRGASAPPGAAALGDDDARPRRRAARVPISLPIRKLRPACEGAWTDPRRGGARRRRQRRLRSGRRLEDAGQRFGARGRLGRRGDGRRIARRTVLAGRDPHALGGGGAPRAARRRRHRRVARGPARFERAQLGAVQARRRRSSAQPRGSTKSPSAAGAAARVRGASSSAVSGCAPGILEVDRGELDELALQEVVDDAGLLPLARLHPLVVQALPHQLGDVARDDLQPARVAVLGQRVLQVGGALEAILLPLGERLADDVLQLGLDLRVLRRAAAGSWRCAPARRSGSRSRRRRGASRSASRRAGSRPRRCRRASRPLRRAPPRGTGSSSSL